MYQRWVWHGPQACIGSHGEWNSPVGQRRFYVSGRYPSFGGDGTRWGTIIGVLVPWSAFRVYCIASAAAHCRVLHCVALAVCRVLHCSVRVHGLHTSLYLMNTCCPCSLGACYSSTIVVVASRPGAVASMAATPYTLTERMRAGTKQVHDVSDRLVNLKLAFVLTDRRLYAEAIALFAPIYQKLEAAIARHKGHPQLRHLAPLLEDISRTPGFESDLHFHLGNAEEVSELKRRQAEGNPTELQRYLRHLDELEAEDPALLAAFVYHMYMAIFAGGFIIKKMVRRAMGLAGDDGVRLLSFNATVDTKVSVSVPVSVSVSAPVSVPVSVSVSASVSVSLCLCVFPCVLPLIRDK